MWWLLLFFFQMRPYRNLFLETQLRLLCRRPYSLEKSGIASAIASSSSRVGEGVRDLAFRPLFVGLAVEEVDALVVAVVGVASTGLDLFLPADVDALADSLESLARSCWFSALKMWRDWNANTGGWFL
jgi:hypothetical protein